MKKMSSLEIQYWEKYLETLTKQEHPINPKVEASFAGNKEITDELLQLYLSGKKTAGSSILEDFISAGDPLPKVGNYWIFLNSKNEPSCILKTIKIVLNKFRDVTVEIAIAEGEGDLSLEYWRKVHEEIYAPNLSGWGVSNIEEATVITEFFEIIYR
jgi:5-formyltetrahydrofolate cyclo-ligase